MIEGHCLVMGMPFYRIRGSYDERVAGDSIGRIGQNENDDVDHLDAGAIHRSDHGR